MSNLAMGYHRAGKLDQALPLFDRTLNLMTQHLGLEHPYTQNAMNNLACSHRDAGELDQALPFFEEIVKLKEASLGRNHPSTLNSMVELADTFVRMKNDAKAETLYRDALERLRPPFSNAPSREIPVLGLILHHLADVLREPSMLDEARSFAEEAVAAYERHLDWPGNERDHAYVVLQAVLEDLGDTSGLEAARLRHMKGLRAAAGNGDVFALNNLAWRLATSSDSAIRDGRSAVDFAEKAVAKTDRNPGTLDTLAAAYAEAGDFPKAASVQRKAIGLCQDEEMKSSFMTRLKLYESNHPYREP